MAERKSTRAINARKKAVEAARAFQEREERLLSLAEDFFKISESNGTAAIEKKIVELRQQLVQAEKASEAEQAKVIARFKEESVNNSEIASRLDLSVAEVRKSVAEVRKLAKLKEPTQTDQSTDERKDDES